MKYIPWVELILHCIAIAAIWGTLWAIFGHYKVGLIVVSSASLLFFLLVIVGFVHMLGNYPDDDIHNGSGEADV